jgi:hypothetical protein
MQEHIEPVTHADRHMTAQQKDADAAVFSEGFLARDFIAAVKAGPQALLHTPGWGADLSSARLSRVIYERFADTDGDVLLAHLIRVFGKAVREGDENAVQLAKAFADGYAQFHEGETV